MNTDVGDSPSYASHTSPPPTRAIASTSAKKMTKTQTQNANRNIARSGRVKGVVDAWEMFRENLSSHFHRLKEHSMMHKPKIKGFTTINSKTALCRSPHSESRRPMPLGRAV